MGRKSHRIIIDRKKVIADIGVNSKLSEIQILNMVNFVEKNIKEHMRSDAMPDIFIKKFIRFVPDRLAMYKVISKKYGRMLADEYRGKGIYTKKMFEVDFEYLMNNFIRESERYRRRLMTGNKKTYFTNYYKKYI